MIVKRHHRTAVRRTAARANAPLHPVQSSARGGGCCCGSAIRGPLPSHQSFTLIEVILALVISTGILGVALYFYSQAEQLRVQVLQETARITAARLLMERLTVELGLACPTAGLPKQFSGSLDRIQFLKLDMPHYASRTNTVGAVSGSSAFRLISYSVYPSSTATNITGLARSEEPLSKPAMVITNEAILASANVNVARPVVLFTDQLHFMRFRYWDGTEWLDSWNAPDLPSGVEVSLGVTPLPEGLTLEEYTGDLYQRVIYLPQRPAAQATSVDVTRREEAEGF